VAELGYDEAAELAHFGAKVLHARTVEPLEADGIPVDIRFVQRPDQPGTRIRASAQAGPSLVRSVAATTGLAILRLNGPGMAYTPGIAKQVFDRLAHRSINVINMATSQASFALLLEEKDVAGAQAALAPLVGGVIRSIEALPGRTLVCVVGRGLGETPGSAARILGAVAAQGVNVEMISLGASMIAIDFIVQASQTDAAVRAIHDAFGAAGQPANGTERRKVPA